MNLPFPLLLAAVEVDPVLSKLVILALVIILIGFFSRLFKQPYIIAYIIAGVLLGPSGFGIFTNESLIAHLGSLGLVLLMFFIGMEMSLHKLIANWRVSFFGTLLQIIISILLVWIIGSYFQWPINRVVMIGFVISLSSTAVVIKLLQDRHELATSIGQNVIGILIAQDIFIVPMLIILGYMGGTPPSTSEVFIQLSAGVVIIALLSWIIRKKAIHLPFNKYWKDDKELQVFISFTLCFGFAVLTGLAGLSSALGAFIAGILVSTARSTRPFHEGLHSFRVVFVALFFVSVGMIINLDFLGDHVLEITVLLIAVFVTNNLINAIVIKLLGESWRASLYSGALLSQIGEFSFVLASTGYYHNIITDYAYQLTVAVIALSLLLSPPWVSIMRKLAFTEQKEISKS